MVKARAERLTILKYKLNGFPFFRPFLAKRSALLRAAYPGNKAGVSSFRLERLLPHEEAKLVWRDAP